MNYEQKYIEALEKLQEALAPTEDGCKISGLTRGCIENIFPELKENEEERIRKAILELVKQSSEILDKQNQNNMIAWLEKQGEQTHAALSQSSNQGLYTTESVFKVGEWIITTYGVVYQIKDIQGPNVTLIEPNGDESIFDISFLDNAQLWTITDAEDGDVLFGEIDGEVFVFLFNQIQDRWIVAHAYYSETDGEFIEKAYLHRYHSFSPATKEQHNLLFQKMKEAGYEYDAEKKELKRIEYKIEIPFGAKDSELQEVTYYIPKGFHAEIDDDKVVIKKGKKNTAWSEEDEKIALSIKQIMNCASLLNIVPDKTERIRTWLKTLKQRI